MIAAPDVTKQALHWLVVLQDDEATEADRRNFDRWLAEDRSHAEAWQRAQQVWDYAGVAEPAFRAAERRPARAVPPSLSSSPRRMTMRRLALAACVAILALGGLFAGRPDLLAEQRTAAGERRTIVLTDGSVVEMGSATALSAIMGADLRRIVLYGGEAFFTVAPDPSRPFVVEAEDGRIRALGTAFNVKDADGRVSVAVTEHAVSVSLPSAQAVEVGEGGQVQYGPDGIAAVSPADLRQVQAWRRGRLIFQDAPLREVVGELGRHRGEPVLITDDRIAGMSVTAVFDTTRTDEALETIAATLPVRITHIGGLLTLIRPAE